MPSPNGGRASQMAPLCSLPIEVQMYLVLPVIFLLTARATDLSRLGALYLLSLVFAWYAPQLSYRLSGAMFGPCFFAGILALAMRSRVKPRFPAGFWSIFLISVVCTYIVIEDATPGIHHLPLQVGICLLVGFAIPLFHQSSSVSLNHVTHQLAKYSYGIYLFHCVSLWLAYYAFPLASAAGKAIFALGSLIALSVISYHVLESPAISLGARLSRRVKGRVSRELLN